VNRAVATIVTATILLAGCQKRTLHRITLITDQSWTIGEARTCSFIDAKQDVMRCVTVSRTDAPPETQIEHKYLVDAEFNKMPPATDEWYGVVCRLDSFTHATCQVE
jgi:hypothetical protein